MRSISMTGLLAVIGTLSPVLAQNLLVNGSFTDPPIDPPDTCAHSTVPVTGWTGLSDRNDNLYIPPCRDGAHASMQGWGVGTRQTSQTITVTPGTTYTLSGVWFIGHMGTIGWNSATAELHNGPNATDPMIARAFATKSGDGDTGNWLPFAVNGVPTGTQMTIVLKSDNNGPVGFALHVDDVKLQEATCLNPPSITDISVTHGARDTVLNNVTINGTNFTAGKTSVKLTRVDQPDIVATNVVVNGTTSLTCTLDLTGAAPGLRDVVVAVGDTAPNQLNCDPATLLGAFRVILPAFSNGGFELPTAPGACPPVPLPGVPTDWAFIESASYGYTNAAIRDSDSYVPSCPSPEGDHYASSLSTNDGGAGGEAIIYQTFAATANTGYTLSGFFAGGGLNVVKLELRDGDVGAAALGSQIVHDSADGAYDWKYATVFGRPSGDMMTAVWYIDLNGTGPHASHADGLTLEVCDSPVSVTAIQPNVGVNNGSISITNLAGTGFVVGGTPVVQLVKGSARITATNVQVVSPTQITCDFDLTGAVSGKYSLLVKQGGCFGVLPDTEIGAFLVAATEFMNGDFEDPTAPVDCGPPPVTIGGVPTGWNTDTQMRRDGNAPVPPSCPSPADGHYGSLSSDAGGTLRAWQTISVVPGQPYSFGGWFAGSGDCVISLLDGDEWGTVLASTNVYTGGSGTAWLEGSVSSMANSSVMTVVWELQNTNLGSPGGHADGLTFGSDCPLNWADTDADDDVDMDDFAAWQRCITIAGDIPADPPYCRCFDRVEPYGQVDAQDFPAFARCVSGPSIPWTGCDP